MQAAGQPEHGMHTFDEASSELFPKRKEFAHGPGDLMPEAYWAAVLAEPVAPGRHGIPIQSRRLSEIPRHVLRVSCRKCDRIVEIQTADELRLYGRHAIWKDVGNALLEANCRHRTGSRDDDGCWPNFEHV